MEVQRRSKTALLAGLKLMFSGPTKVQLWQTTTTKSAVGNIRKVWVYFLGKYSANIFCQQHRNLGLVAARRWSSGNARRRHGNLAVCSSGFKTTQVVGVRVSQWEASVTCIMPAEISPWILAMFVTGVGFPMF